ncbi:MAG: hypothetical protein HND48_03860 [Chloroflexi bacterium]|nr:hypothetical protein [Chloroflexota bacterium]
MAGVGRSRRCAHRYDRPHHRWPRTWLGAAAFTILLGRTVIGLSRYRTSRSPKVIGMMEMGYGFVTSILTGTGYSIGV